MEDKRVIQSHVFFEDKAWFVSTIDRPSSAMLDPTGRFLETIVWEWNVAERKKGDLMYEDGVPLGCYNNHFHICESLMKTGEFPKESEADND